MLEKDRRKLPISGVGINYEPFNDYRCTDNVELAEKSLIGYKLCSNNQPKMKFYKCNGVVIWYNKISPNQLMPKKCDSNLTIGEYISSCLESPPFFAQCLDKFHFIALEKKCAYYNENEIDFRQLQKVLYRIINSVANYEKYLDKYQYIQYREQRLPPWLQ